MSTPSIPEIESLMDEYDAIGAAKRERGESDVLEVITSLEWQQELWRRGCGVYLGNHVYLSHDWPRDTVTYTNRVFGESITIDTFMNQDRTV